MIAFVDDGERDEFIAEQGEPVIVLALCEQSALVLRPGVLYHFEVVPDCDACIMIALSLGEANVLPHAVTIREVPREQAHLHIPEVRTE